MLHRDLALWCDLGEMMDWKAVAARGNLQQTVGQSGICYVSLSTYIVHVFRNTL